MEYKILKAEEVPEEIGAVPGSVGMAAVDGDEVVAFVGLNKVVHMDPLWIRPDRRKSPFLLRRLWRATKDFMLSIGGKQIGGITMGEDSAEIIEKIATRLTGAEIVEGARFIHIELGK